MLRCLRRTVLNSILKVSGENFPPVIVCNLNAKELGTVDYRTKILGDFDRQFTILKRNFVAGKDSNEWGQPYFRPEVPTPPAPLPAVEEETRSEVSTVEPEPDTHTVMRKFLAIRTTETLHLLLAI
jgi:hypothetical protein